MPWLVIIFVIVGLAALGWGIYGLVVGWGLEEIPPPRPMPFIQSAVATSAHSVHLTLYKNPGWIRVERYRPSDQSTVTLPATELSEFDDPDFLEANETYKYRARYTTPTDAPWSASQPELGKEVKTLDLTDALNKGQLIFPDPGWEGYSLVQRFEPGVLSRSGDLVSLTLRASSMGLSIERIYISQADPAGDPYDSVAYRQTMQDTVFKPALVIPPSPPNQSTTRVLPAISYTLDHTKPLLIAIDFSGTPESGIMWKQVPPREAVAYFKLQGSLQPGEEPEARKTDRSGYTRTPVDTTKGGIYLIERIDVG